MRAEKVKDLVTSFLNSNPELKRNKGLGFCGKAVIELRKTLNKLGIKSLVLYGTEFSDNEFGLACMTGLQKTLLGIKNNGRIAEYREIAKRYFREDNRLNPGIGHIVLVCGQHILDPTGTQFDLPYVYPAEQFFKTWKTIDTAHDVQMTEHFSMYNLIPHPDFRLRCY